MTKNNLVEWIKNAFIRITKKEWIRRAAMRAVKTVAQTAVATIGTTALLSEVNWGVTASASLLAGILSLLTSVAGLPEINKDSEKEKEK